MRIHLTQLPGGVRVVTSPMPHMASVSLGLWVGGGGRQEPRVLNGACHFIEHMLFKGTRRRSAAQISQEVEGVGGYLNAFTGEENTCFYSKARHDRAGELMEVLADMFLNSRFDARDIAKERRVIEEEWSMYMDQPHHHVQEVLNAIQWPNHPLGRPLTGTPRTLRRIGGAELREFQARHYTAPVVVVAAAGRVSHRAVLELVAKLARQVPRGGKPGCEPFEARQTAPGLRAVRRATEQAQLALGVRTCSRHDPRRFALRLLNTLVAENMSSRLFQVIREDRGLAYNIYSSLSYFDDTGDLVISAGLDPGKLNQTLGLILTEMGRLRREVVGRAEFQRARDYVLGQFDLGLENTESRMMWLGEQVLTYGNVMDPTAVKRKLAAVTAAAVRNAARDFFRPERLNLALVSPLRSAEPLRRRLEGRAHGLSDS